MVGLSIKNQEMLIDKKLGSFRDTFMKSSLRWTISGEMRAGSWNLRVRKPGIVSRHGGASEFMMMSAVTRSVRVSRRMTR